ncbi:MAG: hypothetical protein ABFS86_05090 [Planctomycetota bacterium]
MTSRPVTFRAVQLRLLVWLRLRTMFRSRRSGGQVIATVLGLVVLTALSGTLGLITLEITRGLSATESLERAAEWTHLVLFVVWMMLVTMPVLGFAGNEFYDITKLFIYPVSHRTVFVAQTIGMLFGGTALFFLPTLLGLAVGLPGGPAVRLLRVGGIVLFLFHCVAFAQLLQLLLLNLLRSRKFRDLVPIVAALFSGGIYLSFRLFGESGDPQASMEAFLDRGFSDWLAPLPTDWLAGLIAPGAGLGHVIVFLVAFVPLTLLVLVLAAVLQERAFHGDLAAGPPVRANGAARSRWRAPRLLRRLPGTVRAIARKELRTVGREPVVKALFIQQFVFILVPIGFATASSPSALSWAIYAFLFVESILALNLLGLEGPGIVQLLSTPVPRRRILGGKVLANLVLWGPLNFLLLAIVLTLMGVFTRLPDPLGILVLGIESVSGLLILLGLGCVLSVHAPFRIGARGRRALSQGQSNEGCLHGLSRLLALLVLALLMVPVGILCRALGPGIWSFGALLWAGFVLWLGVASASRTLAAREERIIEILSRGGA